VKSKLLFCLLITVLLITGLAQAQQPKKIPRIGVLVTGSRSNASPRLQAFQQSLHELGYAEGKHIAFEYRYAEGKSETLPELVADLVNLKVDVILADTSNATQAAKDATQTIPVVFTIANDPVGDGQVASLARPGGNLTGFSLFATDLNGKRLDLLKEAFPKITQVAYFARLGISRAEQRHLSELRFKEAEAAAKELGLRLQPLGAKGADDLESAFDAAKRAGTHALIISPSSFAALLR
jgi:putative ABC transport system substrate-binding protein